MAIIAAITVVKGRGIVADSGRLASASAVSVSFNTAYISNLKVATVNGATGSVFEYCPPSAAYSLVYESNQTVATITTAIEA